MTRTLALYPGIAAAEPGMAAGLGEMSAARASLDQFERVSGCPVGELAITASGPELRADRACELAMIATSVAATAAWRKIDGRVDGVLGFSIGAYAALEAAKVVRLDQIVAMIDIVLEASRALEGRFEMAALTGVPRKELELACRRAGTEVAAEITAAQFLVAGPRPSMALLELGLAHRSLRWKTLPVRWPVHTSYMKPVSAALEQARGEIGPLMAPRVPVYATSTQGRIETAEDAWKLITGQMWQPQSLPRALRAAMRDGFTQAVELGPGETLRRALRWTCRDRIATKPVPWENLEGRE